MSMRRNGELIGKVRAGKIWPGIRQMPEGGGGRALDTVLGSMVSGYSFKKPRKRSVCSRFPVPGFPVRQLRRLGRAEVAKRPQKLREFA